MHTGKIIEEITIKFGTELKPTQNSWKSQLFTYITFCNPFTQFYWFPCDKQMAYLIIMQGIENILIAGH